MEESIHNGFKFFKSLFEGTSISIDQINFVVAQLCAVLLGAFMRINLSPDRFSPNIRHAFEIVCGILIAYFCFGKQLLHLFFQSLICYLLLRLMDEEDKDNTAPKLLIFGGSYENIILFVAMTYLGILHLHRMYFDYAGYTLDITGPLMINTQRLSSLAFNLHDGKHPHNTKITPYMKKLAITSAPNYLEFMSYVFSFHNLLCGPFCFFADYKQFIHADYQYNQQPLTNGTMDRHKHNNSMVSPPCPNKETIKKLFTSLVFGISTIFLIPIYPGHLITDESFAKESFLYKNWLVVIVTSLQRHKYYCAWKLGEAANTSAGLGFVGYDSSDQAKWGLIDNANIFNIEFARSIKELLDNWNMSSVGWLRLIIYERTGSLWMVFMFSAIWHGFYPGYYITFLTTALFMHASKILRRNLRIFFVSKALHLRAYHVLTFLITKITMPYAGFPFMLLAFYPTLFTYKCLYFYCHISALLIISCHSLSKKFFQKN